MDVLPELRIQMRLNIITDGPGEVQYNTGFHTGGPFGVETLNLLPLPTSTVNGPQIQVLETSADEKVTGVSDAEKKQKLKKTSRGKKPQTEDESDSKLSRRSRSSVSSHRRKKHGSSETGHRRSRSKESLADRSTTSSRPPADENDFLFIPSVKSSKPGSIVIEEIVDQPVLSTAPTYEQTEGPSVQWRHEPILSGPSSAEFSRPSPAQEDLELPNRLSFNESLVAPPPEIAPFRPQIAPGEHRDRPQMGSRNSGFTDSARASSIRSSALETAPDLNGAFSYIPQQHQAAQQPRKSVSGSQKSENSASQSTVESRPSRVPPTRQRETTFPVEEESYNPPSWESQRQTIPTEIKQPQEIPAKPAPASHSESGLGSAHGLSPSQTPTPIHKKPEKSETINISFESREWFTEIIPSQPRPTPEAKVPAVPSVLLTADGRRETRPVKPRSAEEPRLLEEGRPLGERFQEKPRLFKEAGQEERRAYGELPQARSHLYEEPLQKERRPVGDYLPKKTQPFEATQENSYESALPPRFEKETTFGIEPDSQSEPSTPRPERYTEKKMNTITYEEELKIHVEKRTETTLQPRLQLKESEVENTTEKILWKSEPTVFETREPIYMEPVSVTGNTPPGATSLWVKPLDDSQLQSNPRKVQELLREHQKPFNQWLKESQELRPVEERIPTLFGQTQNASTSSNKQLNSELAKLEKDLQQSLRKIPSPIREMLHLSELPKTDWLRLEPTAQETRQVSKPVPQKHGNELSKVMEEVLYENVPLPEGLFSGKELNHHVDQPLMSQSYPPSTENNNRIPSWDWDESTAPRDQNLRSRYQQSPKVADLFGQQPVSVEKSSSKAIPSLFYRLPEPPPKPPPPPPPLTLFSSNFIGLKPIKEESRVPSETTHESSEPGSMSDSENVYHPVSQTQKQQAQPVIRLTTKEIDEQPKATSPRFVRRQGLPEPPPPPPAQPYSEYVVQKRVMPSAKIFELYTRQTQPRKGVLVSTFANYLPQPQTPEHIEVESTKSTATSIDDERSSISSGVRRPNSKPISRQQSGSTLIEENLADYVQDGRLSPFNIGGTNSYDGSTMSRDSMVSETSLHADRPHRFFSPNPENSSASSTPIPGSRLPVSSDLTAGLKKRPQRNSPLLTTNTNLPPVPEYADPSLDLSTVQSGVFPDQKILLNEVDRQYMVEETVEEVLEIFNPPLKVVRPEPDINPVIHKMGRNFPDDDLHSIDQEGSGINPVRPTGGPARDDDIASTTTLTDENFNDYNQGRLTPIYQLDDDGSIYDAYGRLRHDSLRYAELKRQRTLSGDGSLTRHQNLAVQSTLTSEQGVRDQPRAKPTVQTDL